jgi:hypothetical protein
MLMGFRQIAIAMAVAALVLVAGCKVSVDKAGKNGEEKVEIKTPFGGLKVNEQPDPKDVGMAIYPGAKLEAKQHDHNDNANVNIDMPMFGLKVVALKYHIDDSPDKVAAFYRDQLHSYGKVVECRGAGSDDENINLGSNSKKADQINQPVACEKNDPQSDVLTLKAGTRGNQHLAKVEPMGKGSKLTLLYVKAHMREDEKKDSL